MGRLRKGYIKPYTAKWERMADGLARDWVEIVACLRCGAPNIEGYCCNRCGCPCGGTGRCDCSGKVEIKA